MGEDTEGMVESTSKLRGLVKGMTGFDIMEDEKTFKSIYDIVVGIGEKWQDLNDIDRAALLEALAGKRGGNALAATLNNIKDLKASYETALSASGSAAKEQANYERSIQYSIDRLRATAQDLAQDFMSSDVIKGSVDALNSILEIIDKLIEQTGSLIPIVTALGTAFASIKLGKNVGDFLDIAGTGLGGGKSDVWGKLKGTLGKKVNIGGKVKNTIDNIDPADMEMLAGTMYEVEAASAGAGEAVGGLTVSVGVLAGAIVAAAALVIGTLYKLSTAQGEINKQAKEAYDSYSQTTSSLSDYKDRIIELRGITDDSTKSIEEQQAAREELLQIQSEMVDQFGIEAGKVDILRDSVDSLNTAFETLNSSAYQEFLNNVNKNEGWQGFWNGFSNLVNGYDNNMDSIKSQMEEVHKGFDILTKSDLKDFKRAFEKYGLKTTESLNESTGLFSLGVSDDNLEHYYNTILKIQKDLQEDNRFSQALTNEANRVKEILDDIGSSYNTYLEQEVIFPKYGEDVANIRSIMAELHQAQLENNEEETEDLSKKLTEAYESIYQNGDIDASSKQWFEKLLSEYQGLIDRQEFIMKIKPEIATDESKTFQDKINQLKESGLSQSEIQEMVSIAQKHNTAGADSYLKALGWDTQTIEAIRYLQRLVDENPISLDFVLDEGGISKLPQEVMDIIGDSFNKLSDEDKQIVEGFSLKQIQDEISMVKNDYRKMLADFSKEGNVDLTIRPVIDSEEMQKAGWDVPNGEISTTFKAGEFVWQGDEENGQYVYIHYTPILPDGTVLTEDQLTDYVNNTLEGSQNILNADDKGLVIKVDTDLGLTENEIKAFKNNGVISQGIQNFLDKTNKWDDEVHQVEAAYYDVNDSAGFVDKALDSLIMKSKQLSDNAKETSFSSTIDSLSELNKQFDTVDKAFAELFDKDDGKVDLDSIKAIKDAFSEIDGFDIDSISEQLNGLLNATSGEEAQDSVNKLISRFIEESKILETVDDSNKDLIASQLELMGVENAEEIVLAALEGRKDAIAAENEFLAATGTDVTNATYQEIAAFVQESNTSETTRQHLAQLAIQKIAVNDAKINTAADCQELLNLANTALASTEAIAKVQELKAILSDSKAGYTRQEWAQKTLNDINSGKFDWGFEKNKIKLDNITVPEVKYKGGGATAAAQKAAKDAGSAAKDAAEQFDWLETKIQRCEEEIQRLDKTVSATYKAWSKRNGAIGSEIDKIREKIALQAKAYEVYMAKANSIPLADSYKQLVMNGGFNIEEISDENLKKLINDFKTWYEKAIQAKDAIEDLNAQIAQLAKQKFDNVKSEFEGFTSEIEHFVSMIDNELSHVENMGKIAGKSFYQAKIDQNDEKLEQLQKEREALANALAEAEANGIEKGSADWIAMRNEIYAVDEAIQKLGFDTEELKKKMREVAKLNFDDLAKQFEQAISVITNQTSITDSVVSLIETSGHMASEGYYKALIKGSKKNVKALKKEYETLSDTLDEAVKSGDIEKYSDEWYEMKDKIDKVKKGIIDATEETIKYAEALRQLKWDAFDRGIEGIERLISETDFYIKLLSYKDLFDKKTGDWTEEGIATRGLLVEKYASYKNEANKLGKEAAKIKKDLDNDPTNTKLMDRYNDLIEKQRQAILNAQEEKKAIQDLYKQAYDNLLDRIQELINKYKEAIKTAKDLHDYENTINEKTKAVNDIQKQILAYSGDDSEETRATLQKLNSDLINAQKDLQETEYDRYIQDQENLMDQFYNDLQTWVNERLDNLDALLTEAIRATNASADTVSEVINREAGTNRINLSEEMNKIWSSYSAEDSPASKTFNIMTETKGVTDDILKQATDLIKKTELEDYLDDLFGDDSDFIENLIDVDTNTKDMKEAIKTTNDALDNIESKIEEYSGDIGEKIDGVKDAIKDLDLSVTVNVDASTGQTDVDTGGDGGDDNPKTPEKPKDPNDGKKFGYKIDGVGMLYDSPNTAEERLERDAEKYAREKSNKVPTSEKSAAYSRFLKDYKSQHKVVSGYFKHGGIVGSNTSILDILAELLGEDHMIAAKEGERVLTEDQNKSFEKMVNANFTPLDTGLKDKYSLDKMIEGMTHISTPNVDNMSNVGNNTTVGDINITLPNVTSKEEFVQWLRTDGQIEKIVQSMTTGRMLGGNSFAKMKY